MAVTIKDVAEQCGLSVTTVSLVLNNKPNRISEKTKEKIIKTAEELHYRPNQIAVSMVTKRTHTIGLILPDVSNLYFSELAKAIEEESALQGYTVLYGNTSDDRKKDMEYLKVFLGRGVDALIMVHSHAFSMEDQNKLWKLVQSSHTPILAVDRSVFLPQVPAVMVDQRMGGMAATQHLIQLGHRRIGCITGPKYVNSSTERAFGYRQALESAGIAYDPKLIYHGDFRPQSGAEGLLPLWKQGITALFVCNDMMAMGVYQACQKEGIRIPEELSVVGYDDIFFIEYLYPPLTTVRQPVAEIGKEAAKQIIAMINGQEVGGKSTLFQPELVVRGSTAPYHEK